FRAPIHLGRNLAEDLRQRCSGILAHRIGHHLTRAFLDLGEGLQHLPALARIGDVARDRSVQDRLYILRTVGQGGIGAGHDTLHALGAVFGDEERGDETRDILRRRIAAGSGYDAYRSESRRRLVVSVARAELGIEGRDPSERSALGLASGHGERTASEMESVAVIALIVAIPNYDLRQKRHTAQRGAIIRFELAHADLMDAFETLRHHFHVRLDDGFTELTKLLHVLLVNHVAELLLGYAEFAKQRRDREECAQESVPLHAKLKVGAVGCSARDLETRQGEHTDVFLDDLLAGPS